MADRMMLDTVTDDDFTNQRGAWRDEGTGELVDQSGLSWDELADQQRADAETAQINANRRAFGQYVTIEQAAKQQKLELDHRRAIAGAAMIDSAFRNGGMSDRSLSAAFSEAFGQPIYGGQLMRMNTRNGPETVFAMYGARKDPQGKATIAPVAMMGSRDMLQILKRAGLGDTTNDLQNDIINNSYLGKLTDDQRAAMGVSRPSAPISTGTTVISGAGMRALRGEPRQPSRVSWFSADGNGGFSRGAADRKTGEDWSEDYGTRDPAMRQAKWKVLESNADGMRYENDLTGEVVSVPKGQTLQNVLRGTSEKEKIAQIQAQGRADAARVSAELKRMGYDIDVAKLEESRRHNQAMEKNAAERAAGRGAPRVDANRLKAMGEWLKANGPKLYDPTTGEENGDNPNFDETTWNERRKMYEDMLWTQDGGGAAQPAQGGSVQEPDRDITLPDGSAGRIHNGKTYVRSGTDANGNPQWRPVGTPVARAGQAQGGAASGAVGDMEKPVTELGRGAQTQGQTPTSQKKPLEQESSIGGAVLSPEDERFLDETLRELEALEELDVSVSIPSDSPDYERRVRNAEARRKREEIPDWVKKLSPEEQTRYKAARTAKRGIEAITKEMGKKQGSASDSSADNYVATLDALGPNGALRKKLSRLLSIIDKVGGNANSDF